MSDPIKRHRDRHKRPSEKKDPLERIANALERLADASEIRALNQNKAQQEFMAHLLPMLSKMGKARSRILVGRGEIKIPPPSPDRT